MKKSVLLGIVALAMGTAFANAQEVTYVEDCSQGILINKNTSNWFLTVEGGTNFLFGHGDIHADLKNRFGANAALYVGKWVTPNFGFRFGGSWIMPKGATTVDGMYRKMNEGVNSKGWYTKKFMGVGPEFDVLINLTNWWCGYRPGRVYNAVLHGGAGAYWTFKQAYKENDIKWRAAHNTFLFANIGLQNNFRLSKHVDLFIDLQYEMFDITRELSHDASASLGLNINFGQTEWNCPVTAVCPTWKYTDAEGDALVARLSQADNQIRNLQEQLDACLRRAPKVEKVDCEGLATVYYPIGQATLSSREKNILASVAEVMKSNPDKKYTLTGWADNYTGTPEINTRLRNQRVDGVKNFLVKCGVEEGQLNATIDNNDLTDFGAKCAPLDRAVTIKVAD